MRDESVKIKIEVFRNTIIILIAFKKAILLSTQNGIASHLHFLTDVRGNMYTYASHLRYHANDDIP